MNVSTILPAPALSDELVIWSDKPAGDWNEAYPIGNGSFGAMVFGGAAEERIQFNHDTLFNGASHDYSHKGAVTFLPIIRSLLFEGRQEEAHELAGKDFMSVGEDGSNGQKAYQPCGDLTLTFPHIKKPLFFR